MVGLRTIGVLRNQHKIPLQELRRVGEWLLNHHKTPWSGLRFGLSGRKVVFWDSHVGRYVEAGGGGQSVIEFALQPIANDMQKEAQRLRARRQEQIGSVVRNRYVVHNAWVLAGTRMPTRAIWNFHEAGYSTSAIIAEYPRLTPADVQAAIEFESAGGKKVA